MREEAELALGTELIAAPLVKLTYPPPGEQFDSEHRSAEHS
jgi:hypothetical protein